MKNQLIKLVKIGTGVLVGAVVVECVNSAVNRNQVTKSNINDLSAKLARFVKSNEDILRSIAIDNKLPNLLIDTTIYASDSIVYNTTMQVNDNTSGKRCLYSDIQNDNPNHNISLYLPNMIRMYGKKEAYKHACHTYIGSLLCDSVNVHTIPHSRSTAQYNRDVKRIYKMCTR